MSALEYSRCIKIDFDKEISTDVDVLLDQEVSDITSLVQGVSASYTYSSTYDAAKAFDGSTSTYYRTTTGQWIGFNFSEPATLEQFDLYLSAYQPRNYEIRGSNNNTDWTVVTSGTVSNSGWNSIHFDPTTFKYWRFYVVTQLSSRSYLYEIKVYGILPQHKTAGWTVIGQEYDMQPEGVLSNVEYVVKRVTKSEDNLSIYLWLNFPERMKDPQGLVTVSYSKTLDNLQGAYGSVVDDFEITFTPTDITPIFNPHGIENIEVALSLETELVQAYYSSYYNGDENIEVNLSAETELIHVDDIET